MKLSIVETLSRYEIENEFFVREPYALISIRRPGSRFSNAMCLNRCVGCCHLMLHEWDLDDNCGQCKLVRLSIRQSLKLVEFVSQHRDDCTRLVIQSEFPSSQLVGIAETLARWLDVPIIRSEDWLRPDNDTVVTLEMAMASDEPFGESRSTDETHTDSFNDAVFTAFSSVVATCSVAMVWSHRARECQSIRDMDLQGLEVALGISFKLAKSNTQPCSYDSNVESKHCDPKNWLYTYANALDVPLCPFAGCEKCLSKLTLRKWPVCLGLILDPSQLPPTFDRVLDAGGTWAILTNAAMSDRVAGMLCSIVTIRRTLHANLDLQIFTIHRDHNWGVDVLHDLFWGSQQS